MGIILADTSPTTKVAVPLHFQEKPVCMVLPSINRGKSMKVQQGVLRVSSLSSLIILNEGKGWGGTALLIVQSWKGTQEVVLSLSYPPPRPDQ